MWLINISNCTYGKWVTDTALSFQVFRQKKKLDQLRQKSMPSVQEKHTISNAKRQIPPRGPHKEDGVIEKTALWSSQQWFPRGCFFSSKWEHHARAHSEKAGLNWEAEVTFQEKHTEINMSLHRPSRRRSERKPETLSWFWKFVGLFILLGYTG